MSPHLTTEEEPRDREIAHDCKRPDHSLLHSHLFPCTWLGFPVYSRGVEAEEQSHGPEHQQHLSTSQGASVSMFL